MKSINKIFEDRPHLMDHSEVKELIEYCKDLEGEVIDRDQIKQFSFEDKLASLVRDINNSVDQLIKDDEVALRFGETDRPDYEESVKNLGKYIKDFARENKFRL